jgi:hypothetical protein
MRNICGRLGPSDNHIDLSAPHLEHISRSQRSRTVGLGAVSLCLLGAIGLDPMDAVSALQRWRPAGRRLGGGSSQAAVKFENVRHFGSRISSSA